jgi:hypothetical protein
MCLSGGERDLVLRPFELKDRPGLEERLLRFDPTVSDLNFTAMFMWRNFFRTVWAVTDDHLCILCGGADGRPYALPPVGPDDPERLGAVLARLKECFESRGHAFLVKNADDAFCGRVRGTGRFPGAEFAFDRDSCDYLYLVSELTELSGGRFDAKRNHIRRFERSGPSEVRTFASGEDDGGLIEGCLALSLRWSRERGMDRDEAIALEYEANRELLTNFHGLGLKAITVRRDGLVVGYAIGGMLNSDTVVIHSEKGDNAVPGIYAFLNREFLARCWRNAAYVNREEDIGIEGIRKAKLSYHPCRLVNKSQIVFR